MSLSRPVAAVAALAITATIAACSDAEEPSGLPTPDPTTSAPPEPTETPSAPASEPTESDDPETAELVSEERVLADYQRSIDAYLAAHDPADPDDPDLLTWMDDDALERTQAALQDLVDEGHSYEGGQFIGDPEVLALAPDSALIRDCYRSESQLIDTETREPIGDPESTVHHVHVSLLPRDERWVVVHVRLLEETCTPPE